MLVGLQMSSMEGLLNTPNNTVRDFVEKHSRMEVTKYPREEVECPLICCDWKIKAGLVA